MKVNFINKWFSLEDHIHIRKGKDYLYEMALPRKYFIARVDCLIPQIVENYCLTKYAKKTNNRLYHHWKTELLGHCKTIRGLTPKSGDKERIIYDEFVNSFELNNKDKVLSMIEDKLEDEHISDDFTEYCNDFVQNMDVIVKYSAETIDRDVFMNSVCL